MLDKIKQLYELRQKAEQVKRELENTNVEVNSSGGNIRIIISGAQNVKSVEISDILLGDKNNLESNLKNCFNDAIKKSQELAAQKMKEITGLNIPGF